MAVLTSFLCLNMKNVNIVSLQKLSQLIKVCNFWPSQMDLNTFWLLTLLTMLGYWVWDVGADSEWSGVDCHERIEGKFLQSHGSVWQAGCTLPGQI